MYKLLNVHYKKNWTIAVGAKKHRYILPIAAFIGIAAVHRVYRGNFWDCYYRHNFLWKDIKPPPYICFSSGNIDIVVLLKPAAINTSFCVDAIAAVERNRRNMLAIAVVCMTAAIGILFAALLLVIAAGWTVAIDL